MCSIRGKKYCRRKRWISKRVEEKGNKSTREYVLDEKNGKQRERNCGWIKSAEEIGKENMRTEERDEKWKKNERKSVSERERKELSAEEREGRKKKGEARIRLKERDKERKKTWGN